MRQPDAGSPPGAVDAAGARALFERTVPTLEALARSQCRRYGLDGDEADGFVSFVMMRTLEDDAAILRKFEGRSSLRTYLAMVIANLFRDHRAATMGRWRPSSAARRLGHAGVLLDGYLNRRGHTLEEAVQILLSRDDVHEDEATLRAYASRIPRRPPRSFTNVDTVVRLPSPDGADDPILGEEREARQRQAEDALERALEELPEQDRLLVRLHYWDGLTVAAISRALHLEQKPLYRRMETNLRRLRTSLEAQGVRSDDIMEGVAS